MKGIIPEDIITINKLAGKVFPGKIAGDISRLGGLTNHTYKVDLDQTKYVFRLPGEGTEELINRKYEKISTELACGLGVDTELLYFNEHTGVKISYYLDDADTMSSEMMREKDTIILAAHLLKKLHGCNHDTGIIFDTFEMAAGYEKIIYDNNVELHTDYQGIRDRVMKIKNDLGPGNMVPSHNDPLCENWLRIPGETPQLYLIDWEYAGMNDEIWDLADVSIEAGLSKDADEFMLESYLGRVPEQTERERFAANKIYIDFLWYLWGKTRVPFDGDEMEQYALGRYQRLKENLAQLEVIKCVQG